MSGVSQKEHAELVAERDRLHAAVIASAFAGSRFIADHLTVPPDIVHAAFGRSFTVEGGKVVAFDKAGNTLFSASNPGEPAPFDEALELLVAAYPHRERIMRGSGANGSGAGAGGGAAAGASSISRVEFEALSPGRRMAHIKRGGIVHD